MVLVILSFCFKRADLYTSHFGGGVGSAFCSTLQLSFSFGIFGFVCVILPPISVEVLASYFAVTI